MEETSSEALELHGWSGAPSAFPAHTSPPHSQELSRGPQLSAPGEAQRKEAKSDPAPQASVYPAGLASFRSGF